MAMAATRQRTIVEAMSQPLYDAETAGGLIQAVATAGGDLLELRLDPRLYRDPDEGVLAADLLDAVRRAVDQARQADPERQPE